MTISPINKMLYIGLVICHLAALPTMAINGKYPIKNFTPSDYKAGIQNIDFAQNRDLNLFVANNLGVLSFNGNEWETRAYNTGKKQRSLAFDQSSNRLYVGSQGDFGYFEKNWDYVSLIDRISADIQDFDEVWDVFIYDTKVYFCTFRAIYVYDGASIFTIQHPDGFNRSFFTGNRLFTQTTMGKLFEIEGTQLSKSTHQGQTNQIVAGIIPKDEGYLIFYNSGQIEFSSPFGVKEIFPELALELAGKYVNHVLQLSDSRLVISTQRSGLFLFNTQSRLIENITSKEGLQSNACLRAFQDFTGNLWVGMQSGIALVDINSPLKLINDDIDLQGSGYEAFVTDEGTYYTTSNGIYFLAKNSNKCSFLIGTEGPAYGLQVINNKLYAGHHTGLFLLEKGKARRRAFTDGLWQVKQLRSDPEYAVGGTYSGLYLFRINEQQELEEVQKIGGFDESSRFFEEDRKGSIWVGQYYRGLYKLNLNNSLTEAVVTRASDIYDLPNWEHIILGRVDDELYLGTENGIFKIDQSTDKIVKDELFSSVVGDNWVYLLEQDQQKNVYIFTENRVGFFKQVSLNNYAYIPSSLFQLRQSFNNDLLRVSKNIRNGVFFNANEGFIYYNPDLENQVPIEVPLIVNRIYSVFEDSLLYSRKVFEENPKMIQEIVASNRAKVLQFHVESFQFKEVSNHQYRYFLKGFNEDYGEWTNSPTKEYTNLEEGEYEFYTQKLNYFGELVTGQPISLVIKPPFYKSFGAKAFYAIMGVLTLFIAFVLQRRKYKRRAEKIEETKQMELAQKREEVLQLKEEKMADELRHVNNLLAASTMNLVVKNDFIETIKEELEQVRTNNETSETTRALDKLVKEINSTLRVQEDWKQFEYHFDKVHGDFLQRLTNEFLDLTPGEQKLAAFLRLNMNTKDIANLMGISLRGVEVSRYRLRKKLGLGKHQNLSKFILEY
jgi:ligand-binding sensor domain-containing protein/DNA-binding CsgD family transcriptional regulator